VAPVDLSDGEDYRGHLGKTEDDLYISKPVIDRVSGQLSIQVTRRFLNPDGSFAGVVVGSLNPAQLTRFYDRFDFGATPSMSLIRTDGVVQSSGGSLAYEVGRDLSGTQRFALMRRGADVVFESTDGPDRRPRLEALRKVKGLPIWVNASLDLGQALESSSAALKVNVLAGLVFDRDHPCRDGTPVAVGGKGPPKSQSAPTDARTYEPGHHARDARAGYSHHQRPVRPTTRFAAGVDQ
jgi:hypothetical protein